MGRQRSGINTSVSAPCPTCPGLQIGMGGREGEAGGGVPILVIVLILHWPLDCFNLSIQGGEAASRSHANNGKYVMYQMKKKSLWSDKKISYFSGLTRSISKS